MPMWSMRSSGSWTSISRSRVDRREQRAKRQQNRPMPPTPRPRRFEHDKPRPGPRISPTPRKPSRKLRQRPRHLVPRPPQRMRPHQRRTSLPERASLDRLPKRGNPPRRVHPNVNTNNAPASRRTKLGGPVRVIERTKIRDRSREPQNIPRINRRTHARRQVVPFGPSSSRMPSAASSSRMRSAVAKSREDFATFRSAIFASTNGEPLITSAVTESATVVLKFSVTSAGRAKASLVSIAMPTDCETRCFSHISRVFVRRPRRFADAFKVAASSI